VTFTVSPPVRIAALVGLGITVLFGGAMMMLGRGEESVPTPHVIRHHPFGPGAKAKTTKQASSAPAVLPKKHATTKAKSTPAQPKKTPAKPSPVVTAALAAGLPAPVARALGQHEAVVVALYNPYSEVDGISFAEARAGAELAGAGFVPLNVLSKAQVGKLTEQLGLLPDPGVLVYVRPAALAVKISGFADKETVAQAAQNAARGT
jgi:hypothetical protein